MYRRAYLGVFLSLLLVSGVAWAASPGDVVINEIYPNAPTYYDGSEYIELYNATGDSISLAGWVLTGTEYDGTCGEHHHQIPAGKGISAHGYFLIVRDVVNADSDGFENEFGFLPDLEMYDGSQYYEVDDLRVANTIVMNPDGMDDQIRLIPGTSDYSKSCGGTYNRYEAIWLYDSPAMTNLIDAMEYRYLSCGADQCLGVNVSDNDAFPSYPDEGLSLGRLDTSADTDNSANDFLWEAPTPRAQNVNGIPPDIWSLDYSPCVPGPTDSVLIDCYVTDPDSVKWVKCIYKQGGAPWDTVDMYPDAVEDSLYKVNLPPRPNQTQGRFFVWAADTNDVAGIYPPDANDNPYRYSVGITSISAIQTVDSGDDSSYVAGQAKNITGVVTAGRGTYNANVFIVQDGFGPWTGIQVYDPSASVPAARGDSVTLSGLVSEYYNNTELYLFNGCYTEHGSGYALPDPDTVLTGDLSTVSDLAESYEGVLVRVEGLEVTNDSLPEGTSGMNWEVNDGSGPCRIGDDAYIFYDPEVGDTLYAIVGVFSYSFADYKIEPRDDEDIIGPLALYTFRYSPHAPEATDEVDFSVIVEGSNAIDSVKIYYSTDDGETFDRATMSGMDSLYTVTLGPWSDGTVVDYYAQALDNKGFTATLPQSGTYDFRVGQLTIYEVQSNFKADGDSSLYAGEPVNLSGIVTAATGEYSDYYFFIQNSYVPGAESPAYRGVKVYDRTGSLDVRRGDSVTVSGDVWEYFNETEIAMFFPEAITVHPFSHPLPAAYSLATAAIDTSEEWEGVLVLAANAAVKDPDVGFGEWLISNGGDADTCRVGDDGNYTYEPVLGDSVTVRGIVKYAYKKYTLEPRDECDICRPSQAGIEDRAVPSRIMLSVAPNPIAGGGVVRFALPVSGRVGLKVYNVQGELVKTLLDKRMEAGTYRVDWKSTSSQGDRVTSGIYFFRLETPNGSLVSKVVVSR